MRKFTKRQKVLAVLPGLALSGIVVTNEAVGGNTIATVLGVLGLAFYATAMHLAYMEMHNTCLDSFEQTNEAVTIARNTLNVLDAVIGRKEPA